MDSTPKPANEVKDEQIGQIIELAALLDKSTWYPKKTLLMIEDADRLELLEILQAERQFLDEFCGGDELVLFKS